MATPNFIAGGWMGLVEDKKPFLLTDQAFSKLENAYIFRERVKKREGLKLLGRLGRTLEEQALANTAAAATYTDADILTTLGLRTTELNAEIRPGTDTLPITILIDDGGGSETEILDEDGIGTLVPGSINNLGFTTGTINYITGAISLTFGAPIAAGLAVIITFHYYPSLPAMGSWQRETVTALNQEQTIFWDTKYAYINIAAEQFSEFLSSEMVTWSGSDSDFFLAVNYRGVEPGDRYFFVTNFVNDASNPIRYTNGSSWEKFAPAIASTEQTQNLGTVVNPWNSFAGSMTNLPVVPGSVIITLTPSNITFTDVEEDGTLTGDPTSNTGTINYDTGAITLTINPALAVNQDVNAIYDQAKNQLFQARILVPYYGRLVALNVYEGATIAASTNIPNRARFSQVGNPIASDAWRTDIFGRGGFIDAPVNEDIVSAEFFKDTLIVGFEHSTWQLRYVGEYGLPFLWERISSDFGSESTFASILFDDGVLQIGDKAIVAATSVNAKRIDEQIPDIVFQIQNILNGAKRVHGIRDFRREIVYWAYPTSEEDKTFPDTVLVFNYKNGTYSQFRDSVTCFGTFQPPDSINWDRADIDWDMSNVTWDSTDNQNYFPFPVSGNQQGFIHYYAFTLPDEPSLSISDVDLTVSPNRITAINHNLGTLEIIKISGLVYTAAPSEDLNDRIFQVRKIDDDTFDILEWNGTYYADTPSGAASTYIGNGRITLYPVLNVVTKDFNPYISKGIQGKFIYVDFLTDATEDSQITVNLYGNASTVVKGNMLVGNRAVETSLPAPFYTNESDYAWHRFSATFSAQFIKIQMTYGDVLMNVEETHGNDWVLNALCIWTREGSRGIF